MDLLYIMMQIASLTLLTVMYLIMFGGKPRKKTGHYSKPAWNFLIKKHCAKLLLRLLRWEKARDLEISERSELPRASEVAWDSLAFRAAAPDGTLLELALTQQQDGSAALAVQVYLPDGTVYTLPITDEASLAEAADERAWCAGGLKFVVLEPFVRWRIFYSGLLASPRAASPVHVRLNLIWTAASRPVRHPEDWSAELAATAAATERWRDGGWRHTLEWNGAGGGWEQWGSVQGVLRADDAPEVVVRARGVRERWWAPPHAQLTRPPRMHRALAILATAYDGTAVYLRAHSHSDSGAPTQAISGSIRYANTTVESMRCTDLSLPELAEVRGEIPPAFTVAVGASKQLRLVITVERERTSSRRRPGLYGLPTLAAPAQVTIDGEPGYGLLLLGYAPTSEETSEPPKKAADVPRLRWTALEQLAAAERSLLCVPFAGTAAACPQLVGAKGASLALLASLRGEEYSVPPGFCITTSALERHAAQHPALGDAIRDIERVNEHYDEDTLKERCARAVKLFTETPLESSVRREVAAHLEDLKQAVLDQGLVDDVTFAVRSSAIGEDSEELSAAGQNDTVLGCRDEARVAAGLQRCWASLYSFHSTQYRRLHGQPADCGMGVVVQAVVPARAAGVLFSRHPNSGHPARILLTANYGLGESVVSGHVEPDTVILERFTNGDVKILSTEVGKKSHRVVLKAEGSTEEVALSERESGAPCVSEEECERLGRLAVRQEVLWGAPRDLEWAIYKDKIFLVQARPITSLERWTEYELLHELDTAVMSEQDAFTFANTGECTILVALLTPIEISDYSVMVLPGALTPLSVSTVGKTLLAATYYMTTNQPITPYEGGIPFFISHYHYGINIYNTMMRRVGKKIDLGIRVLEMAVHGHEVADERMHRIACKRNRPSTLDALFTGRLLLKTLFGTEAVVKQTRQIVQNLNIDKLELDDPKQLLVEVSKTNEQLYQCFLNHNRTTTGSVFSQVVAMSILMEGGEEFSLQHLSDIALMLSSCSDVVSAAVPAALAGAARGVLDSGRQSEFCALPPADCLRWLEENCPSVYETISRFLEDHAHRSIKEFDLATKTWGIDPTGLLQSVQSAARVHADQPADKGPKVARTNSEIAASLVSPKKSITRFLLRMVLPLCQRTVSHREETKAQSILAVHKVRLAYLRLATLMRRQWLLPDRDTIFYFTLDELQAYLASREPALIKKALQRQQRFPAWNALKFAEINEGHLQPLETRDPRLARAGGEGGGARLRGTPVCAGDVVGRACVVTDLAEIGQLQRGDILITHSTDIGWSPYFPLLGGVVTELGGLISHGAVIAREYGLPCMVGAGGATSFCRTGDLVLLAGATGVLERLDTATPTPQPSADQPAYPAPDPARAV